MTDAKLLHECDSCLAEVGGYSRKDLLEQGWRWHDAGHERVFVICGDCEREYATRRIANTVA